MATLAHDLKFGLRMLLKTPVVSGVAALSLALGIAANAGMFALLDGFLWNPLPWPDQDELVVFQEQRDGEAVELASGVSVANYRDYIEAGQSFESAFLYGIELANLTGVEVPEQLQVVVSTPDIFEVLEVQPALGRGFRPEEGAEGRGNLLVLTHDFWERRFLADRAVLGQTLTIDGTQHTIIGVMPQDFDMVPANVQAIRPTDYDGELENRGNHGYLAFARLRAGVTPAQAEAALAPVSQRLAGEFPEAKRGWTLRITPMGDFFPGPTDQRMVVILTAVTLFGLLIACANVANLLLGRAEVRQKEISVRTALGAGRARILRQLLTESVTLGVVAGGIGVLLSVYLIRWIASAMPPEMPRSMIPALNPTVLFLTVAVSLGAGVLFGLAPALHATGGELREGLGEGSRGGTAGRRRKRLRNTFVIGEFAVALALLTGAGFLMQAFDSVANTDAGFDTDGLLSFRLSVLEDRYTDDGAVVVYQEELLRALNEIPGATDVAVMSALPRGRNTDRARYSVDGRPVLDAVEQPAATFQAVNADYFAALDVELIRGRLLEESDRADAQPVALVSQALARLEFPDEDALGKTITVRGESRMVVGVVEDVMHERIQLAGQSGEAIYLPIAQYPLRNPSFAIRSEGDPTRLSADVRQAIWSVEADQPVAQLRTVQAHIDESLAGPQALSLFLMIIGAVALSLAAMGIYGVMAHAVEQQRREIGIRMALGAGRGKVVGMVTRTGLTLAGAGMLLGVPLAYLMFRGI
ncbi:MAG: ABC transporter permease, partial [Gemmatimonadetes bacterium]|nr:ABC transporter permease [Gemmatimonadota bacterium]